MDAVKEKEPAAKIENSSGTTDSNHHRKSQRTIKKPSRSNDNNPTVKSTRIWPLVVINIFLIGVIGGAGYYGWKEWSQFVAAQQLQQKKALNDISGANTQIEGKIRNYLDEQLLLLQKINEKQNETLAQQQVEIAENAGRNQLQWTLSEAHFLVRMAGRKVWLEYDITTAIALLKSADEVLSKAAAPQYIPIRDAISKDIASLKKLTVIDVANTLLRVSAVQTETVSLPFAQPEVFYSDEKPEVSDDISEWRRNLSVLWQSIKDNFISIERVDTPIAPFVSRKLQELKRAELSLQLSIAQGALLQRKQQPFNDAINKSLELVSFFDTSSPDVKAVQQELQELAEVKVHASVPDELLALVVLRRYEESNVPMIESQQDVAQ